MIKTNIGDMLYLVEEDITDEKFIEKYKIDTIVNAAKPTLMGSDDKGTVDNTIHKKIDSLLSEQKCTFKDKIKKELGEDGEIDNRIRCERGQAVITNGYGLCNHIIHVVGTEADSKDVNNLNYSFSRVTKLAQCYDNVVNTLKEHRDIENIAIPIISAGNYKFNYVYAFQIAVASIGNALLEWKIHDEEFFNDAGIKRIYFVLKTDSNIDKKDAYTIFEKYLRILKKNEKVVYQTTYRTNLQILKDIRVYDESRGYFFIAKWMRYLIMIVRMMFLPLSFIKDLFGGKILSRRRKGVEIFALCKALFPLVVYFIVSRFDISGVNICVFKGVLIYFMVDTITYLLTLILLADLQPPSANIIRSMILFFINYIEVVFETSVIYFLDIFMCKKTIIDFSQALNFGVFGIDKLEVANMLVYVEAGTKFFFLTLMLGYLAVSIKPKKFK